MSCGQTLRKAGFGSFSIPIAEEIEAYETQHVVFDLVLNTCFGDPRCTSSSLHQKRAGDGGEAR